MLTGISSPPVTIVAMKTLRTAAALVVVGVGAVGLAVLPAVDEVPADMPGIVVGQEPALGGAVPDSGDLEAARNGGGVEAGAEASSVAEASSDADADADANADAGAAGQVLPGDVPESDGSVVALPKPRATQQPVRGVHSDTGVGPMKSSPSPEPAPAPAPAPAPRKAESGASNSGSSSSGSRSSGSSSSSGSSTSSKPKSSGSKSSGSSRPPRPSGLCEWDDDEWECDDDGDDDDDDDDDD